MNRRSFIKSLAGGALGAAAVVGEALAIGPSSAFDIAQLEYDGGLWQPREAAGRKLLLEVEKRTSILVEPEVVAVRPESEALFSHPFALWAGDRGFEPLSEEAVTRLGVYLRAGGFIFIDSSEGVTGGEFDRAVRRELARILPTSRLEPLSAEHVLYKSFYLLDQPYGRVDASPILEAIAQDDRLLVVYGQNDAQGAWARDNFGNYLYDVTPGGERQRELSYRFGINLVMYALCINYKADQVHVPFILKKRSWKVD